MCDKNPAIVTSKEDAVALLRDIQAGCLDQRTPLVVQQMASVLSYLVAARSSETVGESSGGRKQKWVGTYGIMKFVFDQHRSGKSLSVVQKLTFTDEEETEHPLENLGKTTFTNYKNTWAHLVLRGLELLDKTVDDLQEGFYLMTAKPKELKHIQAMDDTAKAKFMHDYIAGDDVFVHGGNASE